MDLHDFIVRELDEIKGEVKVMREDVRKLLEFKWQIGGMVALLSVIVSIVFQFLISYAGAK